MQQLYVEGVELTVKRLHLILLSSEIDSINSEMKIILRYVMHYCCRSSLQYEAIKSQVQQYSTADKIVSTNPFESRAS